MSNFKDSKLYDTIKSGDVSEMLELLNAAEDAALRDTDGSTYLHLAVRERTSQQMLTELIPFVDVTIRDEDGHTALDLLLVDLDTHDTQCLIQVFTDYVMNVILDADMDSISHLVHNGWNAWPIRGLDDLTEYQDAQEYLYGISELQDKTVELHECAQDGDLHTLQSLLQPEPRVQRDLAGMTVLHKAVLFEHIELVKYLTDHHENLINCKDHMGRTAMHYAVTLKSDEIAELLTPKADVSVTDNLGKTADFYQENQNALDQNKIQMTISFLMQLPELEEKVTAIHDAVVSDDTIKLRRLIDRKQLALVRDRSGMAPLHKAVLHQHADIVRYFLSNFPQTVNTTDNWGRSPLHYAAVVPDKGYLYQVLISAGAQEELLDEKQKSPKHYLEHKDELNIKKIKELITYLPSISEYQVSIAKLHAAAVSDDVTKLTNLLSRKGMLSARDSTGLTVLHKAVICEHADIVRVILTTDQTSVTLTDHMGRTPAHYAAALTDGGYIYKLLKTAQADLTITDVAGHTAEFYADHKQALNVKALKHTINQPRPLVVRPVFQARPPSSGRSRPTSRVGSRTGSTANQRASSRESGSAVEGKATYVRSIGVTDNPYARFSAPPPDRDEACYIAQTLGIVLTNSLAEIVQLRPWDPIEYLAHSLYKYAQNIQYLEKQAELIERMQFEHEAQEKENKRIEKCKEERIAMQREEEERQKEEEKERMRVQEEAEREKRRDILSAQTEHLPTLKEEEEEDDNQLKDQHGEGELHKACQNPDGNVAELLQQGFNIAERNIDGKTARELAESAGLTAHMETIDNYVVDFFRKEQYGALEQLMIDGYHSNFPNFIEKLGQEHVDDKTKEILEEMDHYQEKISQVQKNLEDGNHGNMRKALQLLDRKQLAVCKDVRGRTPLHHVVLRGELQAVKSLLIKFPAAINAKDNMNRTPLHYAYTVSEEMTGALINAGANTNCKDTRHRLPSYYKDKKEELEA